MKKKLKNKKALLAITGLMVTQMATPVFANNIENIETFNLNEVKKVVKLDIKEKFPKYLGMNSKTGDIKTFEKESDISKEFDKVFTSKTSDDFGGWMKYEDGYVDYVNNNDKEDYLLFYTVKATETKKNEKDSEKEYELNKNKLINALEIARNFRLDDWKKEHINKFQILINNANVTLINSNSTAKDYDLAYQNLYSFLSNEVFNPVKLSLDKYYENSTSLIGTTEANALIYISKEIKEKEVIIASTVVDNKGKFELPLNNQDKDTKLKILVHDAQGKLIRTKEFSVLKAEENEKTQIKPETKEEIKPLVPEKKETEKVEVISLNEKSLEKFINKVRSNISKDLIETQRVKSDENFTALKYVFMINSQKFAEASNKETNIFQMDTSPFIKNDRTMMPLRYVAYVLGAEVEWNNDTRTAHFTKDGVKASIQIDGNTIEMSNGQTFAMDANPEIKNDRIHVSLTNVSRAFGLTNGDIQDGTNHDIEWNQADKTVTIYIVR